MHVKIEGIMRNLEMKDSVSAIQMAIAPCSMHSVLTAWLLRNACASPFLDSTAHMEKLMSE